MSEDRLDLFEIVRDLARIREIRSQDEFITAAEQVALRAHEAMLRPTEIQIEYRIGTHITRSLDDVWTAMERFGSQTIVHRRRIIRMPWTLFQAPGKPLSSPGIETVQLPET